MTGSGSGTHATIREGKYARIERERRFLMAGPPPPSAVTGSRRIADRYLLGTRLRLRRADYCDSGACEFEFTQKVAADAPGFVQGLITSTYLSQAEYDCSPHSRPPCCPNTRISVSPLEPFMSSISLCTAWSMADVEFSTDQEAQSFTSSPPVVVAQITIHRRFTGGSLVQVAVTTRVPGPPSTAFKSLQIQ